MNRRDFIKSGAGACAIAASGCAIGSGAASNRVRLAIVGCHQKGRGAAVVKNAMQVPGVEIAYVCDVDARARDFAAALVEKTSGFKPTKEKDFRKLLEDKNLDGVICETPDHWHATNAVMAMRAGKNVYVEKPCAFCPQECAVILDTWKKTGKVFQMGSQRRSTPGFIQVMADVRSGALIGTPRWGKCWYMTRRKPIGNGKKVAAPEWLDWDLWQGPAPRTDYVDNAVHYNWHWFREWGTGECGNNSVHFVDIARWCLGEELYPSRVVSGGGKFWIPKGDDWKWPDTQMISYEFADDKFLTWEGTSCVNGKPYMNVSTGAMVYGEKGSVFFAPGGDCELYDEKGKLVKAWDWSGKAIAGVGTAVTNTDNRTSGGWHDTTTLHMQNFADAIRANKPESCASNAEIGTKSTFLALAGNVAQLSGETLKIDSKNGKLLSGGEAAKLWSRTYAKGWELV